MHRPTAALLIVCVAGLLLPSASIADEPTTQPAELPFTISPETTYFTEPLNEDGTVNYLAAINAIYSEGVTPDNNAVAPLIQATGLNISYPGPDDIVPTTVLEQIGIELPPEDELLQTYLGFHSDPTHPEDFDLHDELWDQIGIAHRGPCTPESVPHVVRWLDSNPDALDLLVMASQRAEWFAPLVPNPHIIEVYQNAHETFTDPRIEANGVPRSLPDLWTASANLVAISQSREASRALVARGNLSFAGGYLKDGFADILATRRIGALVGRGPLLLDSLVGIAIEAMANKAAMSMASSVPLSEETARALLREWSTLPPPPSLAEDMSRGERWGCLDMACWGAQHPEDFRRLLAHTVITTSLMEAQMRDSSEPAVEESWADPDHADTVRQLFEQANWDVVLQAVNTHFDQYAEALDMPAEGRAARLEELDALQQQRLVRANDLAVPLNPPTPVSRQAATGWTTDALLSHSSLNLELAARLRDRAGTRHELASIALALAVYRAESGGYPDGLDALSPDIIDEVGFDSFSGQAYIYQPTDDGYVLYSVGMDLTDDGGNEDDDIVIRIGQP